MRVRAREDTGAANGTRRGGERPDAGVCRGPPSNGQRGNFAMRETRWRSAKRIGEPSPAQVTGSLTTMSPSCVLVMVLSLVSLRSWVVLVFPARERALTCFLSLPSS